VSAFPDNLILSYRDAYGAGVMKPLTVSNS
jgi:hypothetical protein